MVGRTMGLVAAVGWLALVASAACGGGGGEADGGGAGGSDGVEQHAGDAAADAADGGCSPEERGWCEPCTCDAQCGDKGVCLEDSHGARYCTHRCKVTLNDCGPGSYCGNFGPAKDDFACLPHTGACAGDGAQCSPCRSDADCASGLRCHEDEIGAKWCAKACTNDDDCGANYGCLAGAAGGAGGAPGDGGVCMPKVGDAVVDNCAVGLRGICEPCAVDQECAEGMQCHSEFLVCTWPCEKKGGPTGLESTCPDGLFCPPATGLCQAPQATGCQGWLVCEGRCKDNEVCDRGVCRLPCDAGCPPFWDCVDGYCRKPGA